MFSKKLNNATIDELYQQLRKRLLDQLEIRELSDKGGYNERLSGLLQFVGRTHGIATHIDLFAMIAEANFITNKYLELQLSNPGLHPLIKNELSGLVSAVNRIETTYRDEVKNIIPRLDNALKCCKT